MPYFYLPVPNNFAFYNELSLFWLQVSLSFDSYYRYLLCDLKHFSSFGERIFCNLEWDVRLHGVHPDPEARSPGQRGGLSVPNLPHIY
jgi:hypothetical protein